MTTVQENVAQLRRLMSQYPGHLVMVNASEFTTRYRDAFSRSSEQELFANEDTRLVPHVSRMLAQGFDVIIGPAGRSNLMVSAGRALLR